MNSDAMVDVDSIHERLTAITPGPWRRVGGDIFAPGDQTMPLLRGRVRTADVRVQSDADAEFVIHAAADIAALLDQLAPSPQADRLRRRRQAGRDRRTVTDWLRRMPRQ
jgi:hypothetical protein